MDVRIEAFREAAQSFAYLARLDLAALRELLANEQLFTELRWKAIKTFLKGEEGIDETSPKKVIKAYYLAGYVNEDDYLRLLDAIEDRNRLSHIYDVETFNDILRKLPDYATLFDRVSAQLGDDMNETR